MERAELENNFVLLSSPNGVRDTRNGIIRESRVVYGPSEHFYEEVIVEETPKKTTRKSSKK